MGGKIKIKTNPHFQVKTPVSLSRRSVSLIDNTTEEHLISRGENRDD